MMRLMIAIPAYDAIRPEFVQSLLKLENRLREDGIPYTVQMQIGSLVYLARDKLAHKALDENCTHVLWLDADMVFPDSIVDDLMFCGKDFVSGLYISRHSPYMGCMFASLYPPQRVLVYPDQPFRIAACGFGVVLMETQVIRDVMMANHGACFLPTGNFGEDLAFCERARGCGHEIWCEPSARAGHVGHVAIWPEDGERMRGSIENLTENDLR